MARFALCDRCGAIIKTAVIKHVSFESNPSNIKLYDVCDKCYEELEKSMKIKKEKDNDSQL